MKFGNMDGHNRGLMTEKLKENIIVRNAEQSFLGVSTYRVDLIDKQETPVVEEDLEAPDWGGTSEVEESEAVQEPLWKTGRPSYLYLRPTAPQAAGMTAAPATSVASVASAASATPATPAAPAAQGPAPAAAGLTVAASMTEPLVQRQPFTISTLGVHKLVVIYPTSEKANSIEVVTDGRGAPKPVSATAIAEAMREVSAGWPHVVVDCRCFYDPDEEQTTRQHIGTHPLVLKRITEHRCFKDELQGVHRQLQVALASVQEKTEKHSLPPQPVHLCFYCRSGEKRSVAMAAIVQKLLQEVNGWRLAKRQDLCSVLWRRKTCGGRCYLCTGQESDERRDAAYAHAIACWRGLCL